MLEEQSITVSEPVKAIGKKLDKELSSVAWGQKRKMFHEAIVESTSRQDMVEIWETLKNKAKAGDFPSIREFLDRTIGTVKHKLDVNDTAAFAKLYLGYDPREMMIPPEERNPS